MTPPDPAVYALKVPPGSKEAVLKNLSRVRSVTETKFKEHVVKKGDTIPRLCQRYGIKKSALLKANKLRKAKVKPGQRLRIPYQTTSYIMVAHAEPSATRAKGKKERAEREEKAKKQEADRRVVHRIKSGETLATLARRYKVSVEQIIAWNSFKNPKRLKVGQKVTLYLEKDTATDSKPDRPGKKNSRKKKNRRG
jgi:LysM repeat protein